MWFYIPLYMEKEDITLFGFIASGVETSRCVATVLYSV
jgi:hypothetical protein